MKQLLLSLTLGLVFCSLSFPQDQGIIRCEDRDAKIPAWTTPGSAFLVDNLLCGQSVRLIAFEHGFYRIQIGQKLAYVDAKYVQMLQSDSSPVTQTDKDGVQAKSWHQETSNAANMDVIIVDRQSHDGSYTYVVPGYSTTTSSISGAVMGSRNSAYYNGVSSSNTIHTPGFAGSYEVTGATLTLRLPDSRVVVVNCNSKINWGHVQRYRSCRIPLTNIVQAEFDGDNAKLKWPVSIDGKKMQQETYKILAVLQGTEAPDK